MIFIQRYGQVGNWESREKENMEAGSEKRLFSVRRARAVLPTPHL